MNTNEVSVFPVRRSILHLPFFRILAIAALLLVTMAMRALGAPSVQDFSSSNNVFGQVFAVDDQTNVYVNANGPIVILNAAGTVIQSNTICPVPALTQRDATGNYYFFGNYTAPRDFGGTTLTNGYMFIAKYDPAGALLWAKV